MGGGGDNKTKMLTGRGGCGVGGSVGYLLMNILDQVHLVKGDIKSEKIKKKGPKEECEVSNNNNNKKKVVMVME